MAPKLEQVAGAEIGAGQSYDCTVTLTTPTTPNNLLVVTAITASYAPTVLTGPDNFVLVREISLGIIKLAVWYREGAPATSSVKVHTSQVASMQVRLAQYSGAAQSGALDKVVVGSALGALISTGRTGVVSQADSIVFCAVANHYSSTAQQAFTGSLTRLLESVSPQIWGGYRIDTDDVRTRLTIHQAITSAVQNFTLDAVLTATRHWLAILCVFRGGSIGPARMTSTGQVALTVTGSGNLTVFGKLVANNPANTTALTVTGSGRMGPFTHQYRLGGWDGVLIGEGTDIPVVEVQGLGGWEMRTSDDDLPQGDGGIRGVDLQSSRQVLFKVNTHSDLTDEREAAAEVEDRLDILLRALVPQRDQDWELIWRDPDQPLKMLRCRPVNLLRDKDWQQILLADQSFALRAADPRHYSAFVRTPRVPNTPVGSIPYILSVLNAGNGYAYPIIQVSPTSVPLTRVELRNETYDLSWVVTAAVPVGSTLTGDMDARATGAPRSVVTIDSQSKYGAWQHPRETFSLAPGSNDLTLTTVPAGAPVTCVVQYRDTWSG